MVRVFWPQPQSAGVPCPERTSHKVLFVCVCVSMCKCSDESFPEPLSLSGHHCCFLGGFFCNLWPSVARCLTSRVNLRTAVRVMVKGSVFACVCTCVMCLTHNQTRVVGSVFLVSGTK